VVTLLRKYQSSLRDNPEEGSSLLFYSTCLEVHFLAALCVKRKHLTYMSRFQVCRSPAAFIVQAQNSLDKTQGMLSTENIKEIAKFGYVLTTLTNKSDRSILHGCFSNFSALIYLL
jgi:hypothetical protein